MKRTRVGGAYRVRVWFPGVRYLEAIPYWKAPLIGSTDFVSCPASRSLFKYYNYGNFNP